MNTSERAGGMFRQSFKHTLLFRIITLMKEGRVLLIAPDPRSNFIQALIQYHSAIKKELLDVN
jgi:hypothetical protein